MNIVYYLLNQFVVEETTNITFMVLLSFIINIFQTNVLSFITANIIEEIYGANKKGAFLYFKYFVGISFLYILLHHIFKYFQNKILTKLRQWIRHNILRIILLVNNEKFSEMNFTKLNSPINRISSVCFLAFNDVITYLLPNLSFLIIVCGYFVYKEALFGAAFFIANMAIIIYLIMNWSNMINSNEEYEKNVGETEAYMVEILNNIDKIIYRGQTEHEIGMFSEKTENSINSAMNFYSNINHHSLFMTILVFIILFISLWYLIRLFFKQNIDLTTFITFFTMLLLYRDKMLIIIQQVPDFLEFLGRSDAVLKHFRNMEHEYQTVLEKKATTNEKINCHRIRFDNVSFKYETNDKYLFRNFNIDLETNDKIIGITGLSGNGKSTFAKLLLKMYKPTEGSIYIDGQDIKDMDANYIRKNITYVNQNSKLFDKKIVENILYGCSDIDACNGHLNEIMQYKKIKDLYKNLDIYNKQSGSLGENLSGGQRQVINIIGGLVNPSKIIILDEPTNALDIDLKQEILDLIRNFKKYKNAIIIITHDKDVYPLFNEKIQI